MSKVGSWSTTPGNNNSTPPDGWPEGQAPSTVNDCAREMMAAIRTYLSDAQYVDLNNTPSYLTATTFSLGTADVTNFHIGRRVKLFDASTLYGTIDSVSATFVSVRLDSGALTASLSSVAISVLSNNDDALPAATWRRRNVIINGNMEIWQRGVTFQAANAATTYTADRFAWNQSTGSSAVTISRAERSANASNVPTIAQAGMLLNSSVRFSVSAADATVGANEYSIFEYVVEGYDWRQIAHRPNIFSFWANSNRSGVYAVAFRNMSATASLSYVQNFTIDTVNTWARFVMTVPEAPTTQSWNYSSGSGLRVAFVLGAGSTFQGGAGNWTAANILATSSQQNFVASAGNVMLLTGIQLESGTRATPLEIRPYAEELSLCQRYYWRGLPCGDLNGNAYTNAALLSWPVSFPVTMRGTPTVAMSIPGITTSGLLGSPTVSSSRPDGCRLVASASGANINCNFSFGASDFIEADAEF